MGFLQVCEAVEAAKLAVAAGETVERKDRANARTRLQTRSSNRTHCRVEPWSRPWGKATADGDPNRWDDTRGRQALKSDGSSTRARIPRAPRYYGTTVIMPIP